MYNRLRRSTRVGRQDELVNLRETRHQRRLSPRPVKRSSRTIDSDSEPDSDSDGQSPESIPPSSPREIESLPSSPVSHRTTSIQPANNSQMVVLKVKDKQRLAVVEGDHEPPFYSIIEGEDASTLDAVPTLEERQLFDRFKQPIYDRDSNAFQINTLHLGKHVMETWYTAPYPAEYSQNEVIYLCEYCLKYMPSNFVRERHAAKCPHHAPPGNEIYRDGPLSVFEVDGAHAPLYCQNLCLLAKLFLDSKTLYYDVEPFLFYVLTKVDTNGARFVGYFSKEKIFGGKLLQRTPINSVSCIVTLPRRENRGLGQLLISLSYLLTRIQGTTGTPEKPLSSLGEKSYRNYWTLTLCYELKKLSSQSRPNISIKALSEITGMTLDDVICGLEQLDWLDDHRIKVDMAQLNRTIYQFEQKKLPTLNPSCLQWSPALYL